MDYPCCNSRHKLVPISIWEYCRFVIHFHLSPRLCPSTAGCIPPSMSSIAICLLFSCFTFHLGFVHPLQDVALHQCLPISSVFTCFTFHLGFVHLLQDVALHQCPPLPSVCCFLFQVGPSFLVMLSCHLLHGRPLDLFPLLGCRSVQRVVYLLSFICYMSGPSPLLFQCVFYNVIYLCSFPDF